MRTPDPTFNAISAAILEGDDTKTKFYTGLPRWALFMQVFLLLSSHMTPLHTSLTLRDELVVLLVKLRLNLPFQDLTYRWRISTSTITRMFYKWINAYVYV